MPRRRPEPSPRPACHAHSCDVLSCSLPGEYKAPRHRAALREYVWFCLDHVREYNKGWDYFTGMDTGEIEAFRKEAVTGHRPTWKTAGRAGSSTEALEESLRRFFGDENPRPKAKPPLPPKQRDALALLAFDDMPSLPDLKKRYKQLVKQTHPDLNRTDAQAEDRFKEITNAYRLLTQTIAKTVSF